MSTTSLKLSDELKERACAAAQRQGISPHAFMIHAIEQAATAAEQRATFLEEALAARTLMHKTGKGYDPAEVSAYLTARIDGQKVARPKARSWRR